MIELDRRIAEAHERLRVATAGDTIVAKLMEQEGVGEVTAWVYGLGMVAILLAPDTSRGSLRD